MTNTLASGRGNAALLFAGNMARHIEPTVYRKDSGVLVVQGQPVFRSGTFRDSMGYQQTWEPLHMDQMAAHFEMLRNRGLFSDIPVRDGHPGFIARGMPGNGKVVGWHTGLVTRELESHTGQKETFLLADYEITDPDARAAWENGTFRNRSSEVGEYTTNDEATFWPVYMGFAFVDIPAVEGLNSVSGFSQSASGRQYTILRESTVTGSTGTPQTSGGNPPQVPTIGLQQFSINGAPTSDPLAVQAHITSLETFRSETLQSGRHSYVDGLATAGRILATQVDGFKAFATGLSDEQFAAWRTAMDVAPVVPALGLHGAPAQQSTPGAPEDAKVVAEVDTLRNIVSMHSARGASPEEIKGLNSYKRLVALDPSAAIL